MQREVCRYAFPVQPSDVADYGPFHHDYPATDIFAPTGSDIVAVTDGIVDWVSREDPWEPVVDDPATRGGLSVAIIGRDGIRYYYSHLLEVAEGVDIGSVVGVGTLLGRLGTTGNAHGTSPHVHFGISRPTEPGDWRARRGEVPPADYLDAWRAGQGRTPEVPGAQDAVCEPAGSRG